MTRRLAVVAIMLACMVAAPAFARHRQAAAAPATASAVTQFCGDRYCPTSAPAPTPAAAPAVPRSHRAKRPRLALDANGNLQLVTVPTAAGIPITVAPEFAPKITGFIADLVARGYHPRRIHCFARGGHVANSLHYRGRACDFDQHGWGLTARPMYHVADLVAKWGLRDGREFHDWGHIDMGPHLRRARSPAAGRSQRKVNRLCHLMCHIEPLLFARTARTARRRIDRKH